MVDRFICILVFVAIPAALLGTLGKLISVEVALAIIWATALLSIVVGLVEYWKDPEAYNRPGG